MLWPCSVQRLCRTGLVRESGRGCMPRTANGITCRRRIRRRQRPRACHREDGANNGKRAVFPVQGSRRPRRSWARLCRYGQSSRAHQPLPGTKVATPRTGGLLSRQRRGHVHLCRFNPRSLDSAASSSSASASPGRRSWTSSPATLRAATPEPEAVALVVHAQDDLI